MLGASWAMATRITSPRQFLRVVCIFWAQKERLSRSILSQIKESQTLIQQGGTGYGELAFVVGSRFQFPFLRSPRILPEGPLGAAEPLFAHARGPIPETWEVGPSSGVVMGSDS